MFYETFSGTLGFAAAIGIITVCVLFFASKFFLNKKKEDGRDFWKSIIPEKISKHDICSYSGKLLIIILVFIAVGFFSSLGRCGEPRVFGLLSRDTINLLFYMGLIDFSVMVLAWEGEV